MFMFNMEVDKKELKEAIVQAGKAIGNNIPIIIGIVLLVSITNALIPNSAFVALFGKSELLNSFIGASMGSVMAGTPITSYILGGEFLKQGVSLMAVTAFLVAWVTVGIVQFPAEALMLSKKFAIVRNVLAFVFSIIVALVTVLIVSLL